MSRSFLLFGFILYSVFLSSLANASDIDLSAPMDKGGWKLIWSEEFDYTGFPDSTKWSYDTEGNVYERPSIGSFKAVILNTPSETQAFSFLPDV